MVQRGQAGAGGRGEGDPVPDTGRDLCLGPGPDHLLDAVGVLAGDQPEADLHQGGGRNDRLASGALVAASDAVDLGGGAGPDAFQRGVSGLARCRAGLGGAQPGGLVEGQLGEERALAVGELGHTVVETRDRDPAVRVVQRGDEPGDGGRRVGYRAAERTGVDVLLGAVQLDLALGEAAHAGADRGGRLVPHAGVGDDHGVGGEPVGPLLDQGAEVRRAGLLLTLDQELEVDGGGGAAGDGEVGPDAECVEEHLPLVVCGAPPVHAAVADHRLERVGVPAVLAGGGLHVVVPVDEDGRGVRVVGRPVGEDRGGAGRLPDLGDREAGLLKLGRQPLGTAPYVPVVDRLGGYGRDAQPGGEVVQEGCAVLLGVRTDGAVRGVAHGLEPSASPAGVFPPTVRGPPRPAVTGYLSMLFLLQLNGSAGQRPVPCCEGGEGVERFR